MRPILPFNDHLLIQHHISYMHMYFILLWQCGTVFSSLALYIIL